MASQYKLLARIPVASSPSQAVTGKGGVRFAILVPGAAAAAALLYDSVGAPVAGTEFLGISCAASQSQAVYFDSAEGRFPFSLGLYVTITGANSVLYVYGS